VSWERSMLMVVGFAERIQGACTIAKKDDSSYYSPVYALTRRLPPLVFHIKTLMFLNSSGVSQRASSAEALGPQYCAACRERPTSNPQSSSSLHYHASICTPPTASRRQATVVVAVVVVKAEAESATGVKEAGYFERQRSSQYIGPSPEIDRTAHLQVLLPPGLNPDLVALFAIVPSVNGLPVFARLSPWLRR